jgi:hypothetical protein
MATRFMPVAGMMDHWPLRAKSDISEGQPNTDNRGLNVVVHEAEPIKDGAK